MEASEEFKWALKIVIKRQMRGLIEQLRENGEEIAIVSADVDGGSCSHFGSPDGEWFMSEQRNITTDFLNFCKSRGKTIKGFPNRGSSLPSVSNAQEFREILQVPVHFPREQNTRPTSGLAQKDGSKTVLRVSVPANLAYGMTDEDLAGIVGQLVVVKLTDSLDAGKSPMKPGTSGTSIKRTRSGRAVCIPRNFKMSPGEEASDSESDTISQLTKLSQDQLKRYEVCTLSGITIDLESVSSTDQQMEVLAGPIIQALDNLQTISKLKNSSIPVKVIVSKDGIGETVQIDVEEPQTNNASSGIPDGTVSVYTDLDVSDTEEFENFPYEDDSVEDPDYEEPKNVHDTKDTRELTGALTKVIGTKSKALEGSFGTRVKKITENERRKKLAYETPIKVHKTEDTWEDSMETPSAFSKMNGARKISMSTSTGTKGRKLTGAEKKKMVVQCPHCGISLVGEQNLKPHIERVHLKLRNHKCSVCSKAFWSASGLENHRIQVHTRKCESCEEYVVESGVWEEGTKANNPREVACQCGAAVTICSTIGVKCSKDKSDKSSKKNYGLTQKFACGVCHKLFLSKRQCEAHGQSHSSLKRFTCEICGASYKGKAVFHNHMFTKHGIYQSKCEVCWKNFSNATTLKVHMAKVHPITLNDAAEVESVVETYSLEAKNTN